jgi:hypothetical protein
MLSQIEQAIQKYGGADDAYKLKLKAGIRDAMGYENHMSRLNQETSSPADIGDIKGLSPAGVNARIASKFGEQDARVAGIQSNAGAIDTTAGTLASEQAAREKAARTTATGQFGINNGVMFDPTNPVESTLSNYMKNPYNTDGTVKSLQQVEAELNTTYGQTEGYAPEDVKKIIETRVPKDFIGNETLYSAMAQGYSRKQASDPSTAGAVRDAMQTTTQTLIDPTTGQQTTESLPKFTLAEIQNKYPDLTDVEAKSIMKPGEQRAILDDIHKSPVLAGEIKTAFDGASSPEEAVVSLMGTEGYKNLKTVLSLEYSNFTGPEIDNLMYQYIRSRQ